MKRKFDLVEHSDYEWEWDTNENTLKPFQPPSKPKSKHSSKPSKSKCKQLIYVNLLVFSLIIIPILAIANLNIDHVTILESIDKVLGERCASKFWKPKNLTQLQVSLDEYVFGQHIAKNLLLSALTRRWGSHQESQKPLVMSFHGWTGSGKNYVAKFIAESLFKKGTKSSYVKIYISTLHFHDDRKVLEYQQNLRDWILGNVTRCPDSLFIFDEVDKMPVGVLDALKPFMDHHSVINGIDMSQVIFILLSNTGGS